jgi:pyruvate kinase
MTLKDLPRTKLVCTIGPASVERVRELIDAGMSVARINFSHGTSDDHKAAVHAVRNAAHQARRSVAVMVDLPGPKIRLGEIEGGETRLERGAGFDLQTNRPTLAQELEIGDRVLLSDGAAELRVTGMSDDGTLQTEVVHGGVVRTRSGVGVPNERLTSDGLTDEDRSGVERALELRVDLIAQSFVRSADDVNALRALLPEDAPLVLAKIETQSAVDDFDAIMTAADGVMVARGDLGIDIPYAEVPLIQKDLVRRAVGRGKFTIVATQMLESMTSAARPTRAEASDVANAVLDGADAVMLSAETAIGAYPVEAAQAMVDICTATERGADQAPRTTDHGGAKGGSTADAAMAMCRTAVRLTDTYADISAIWCFTRSGRTAEFLAMARPRVPIVAFTINPIVARRLAVRGAVVPVVLPAAKAGQPLVDRMAVAARLGRLTVAGESSTVLFVTTSDKPGGVNRLELVRV